MSGNRDDVVHTQVSEYTSLDLKLLGIGFPLHFVTCFQLVLLHHAHRLKHLDACLVEVAVKDHGAALLGVQTALLSLSNPFVAVAVAVEVDRSAGLDVRTQHVDDGRELVFAFGNDSVYTLLEVSQSLSDSSVQHDHGAGAVSLRAYSTELKAVAGESKWRSTVAVGVVAHDIRNLGDVNRHTFFALDIEQVFLVSFLDMVKNVRNLLAKEGRDDCWRCFVGTQTVSVGSTHDRSFQQTIVLVNTHQRLDDEYHEAKVVLRSLAWTVEQDARVGRKAPVVVLTGTVDAVERLFVKQYLEAMLAGNLLHQAHQQHVVVDSQVGFLEDRSALKLVRSDLVVTCLAGNAKLQSLNLKVFHEGLNTLGNGSEVVVVHLLVLGRAVAHPRLLIHFFTSG